MATYPRRTKPAVFTAKSLLNSDGTWTYYDQLWSEERYVDTVVQIVEFYVNNHIGTTHCDGKPVPPEMPWWYAYSDKRNKSKGWYWSERMNKAWDAGGGEVSFIIACITAQHTQWGKGGVETETPFHALEMWRVVKPLRRINLARLLYAENGK